jgi:hypothetical protein
MEVQRLQKCEWCIRLYAPAVYRVKNKGDSFVVCKSCHALIDRYKVVDPEDEFVISLIIQDDV